MKSKVLMIGAAVCAALFLFSGVMLFRQYADEKNSTEAFDHIAALVQEKTPPTNAPQETESPLPEQRSKPHSRRRKLHKRQQRRL